MPFNNPDNFLKSNQRAYLAIMICLISRKCELFTVQFSYLSRSASSILENISHKITQQNTHILHKDTLGILCGQGRYKLIKISICWMPNKNLENNGIYLLK